MVRLRRGVTVCMDVLICIVKRQEAIREADAAQAPGRQLVDIECWIPSFDNHRPLLYALLVFEHCRR